MDPQLVQRLRRHLGKHLPREEAFVEAIYIGDQGDHRVADIVRLHPWAPAPPDPPAATPGGVAASSYGIVCDSAST